MSKWSTQPTDEQERENAAYVWAKSCQRDLAEAATKHDATDIEGFTALRWHFDRLDKAVEQFEIAQEARKAAKK